ncbi:FIST C-terminal domain-containing protein [Aquabacterium sp. A7-Y]|uniref:FIST N-terminal domain-containing protein n=1 Tax=Aquabacterium sp. A7-Y TaxID=1349605 RepID=UPI00223E6E03|nr:FIST N-terminal domain-containing protein [Aquabacterium sp. A7-Y]MCW7540146.1 FIST C-terminal domain-containing protein [Aquabacterium sp. A7-Y]
MVPKFESPSPSILRGMSMQRDPQRAAAELFDQIWQPGLALAVVFCSPGYDRERLAQALRERFGDTPLIGCTTGAEIGPRGYGTDTLTGFSLSSREFSVSVRAIEGLQAHRASDGQALVGDMLGELAAQGASPSRDNTFGFLLIDGSSRQEERVAHSLHVALADIELFGGSAGDGLEMGKHPHVLHGGRFHRDHAVFVLVSTPHPFVVFKTDSFVPTSTRMVITEADPDQRTVREINGEPAAVEYARQVGIDVGQLDITVVARHPVGVMRRGEFYPRTIGWIEDDMSLTFACAIDAGVVLTLAQPTDLLEALRRRLDAIRQHIGTPELLIACDCMCRYHEMVAEGVVRQGGELMAAHGAVGFSTYGEQYNSVHINQALTGVAIGRKRSS